MFFERRVSRSLVRAEKLRVDALREIRQLVGGMKTPRFAWLITVLIFFVSVRLAGAAESLLPGSEPLTLTGDLSVQMRAGIERYLERATLAAIEHRSARASQERNFSSAAAYENSLVPPRERLRAMLGVVDPLERATGLEWMVSTAPGLAPVDASYTITPVQWRVLDGVMGEGLWLRPNNRAAVATVIVLPDADQTPEQLAGVQPGLAAESQVARLLAERGCEVLVPALIDRGSEFSGNPAVRLLPQQPHREWIYRAAFEMGRHVIGYEVQKVLAAVAHLDARATSDKRPLALYGYGEGGLIALHTAALEPRVRATVVSGYFGPREGLWREPLYRNVFGLLREFGDAELASLIAPRALIIEHSEGPRVRSTPPELVVTPGELRTPSEVQRADAVIKKIPNAQPLALVAGDAAQETVSLGDARTHAQLFRALGVQPGKLEARAQLTDTAIADPAKISARQQRQVRELERYTQRLLHASGRARDAVTLDRLDGKSGQPSEVLSENRARFWREVIGKIERPGLPLRPRSRVIFEQPKWVAHEVVLDVLPDVFAWGYLLVPRDLAPGERRPVVVCQHGLEGQPASVMGKTSADGVFTASFCGQLADRGFIVFAPHAPFRGRDAFRLLQRRANPLGLTLFSFIIAQHEAALDWLAMLPFVDADRIGFYGISYGGKAAMRVSPVLERYRATVCAADFNDWIMKNVSTETRYSYVFKGEWELPEWNLGHLFNHAELAALIAPRAFMVERGREDPVAPDAWVAAEFARVQLFYRKLGVPERAQIEFFGGGHRTNGVGSFQFLHRHLDWPEPAPGVKSVQTR
jgi:dienelactone hydrolase